MKKVNDGDTPSEYPFNRNDGLGFNMCQNKTIKAFARAGVLRGLKRLIVFADNDASQVEL